MVADALFVRRFDAVPGHAFATRVETPCSSVDLQRSTTLARRLGAIACTGFNSQSIRGSSMRYGGSSLQASAKGSRREAPGAQFSTWRWLLQTRGIAIGLSGTWRSLAPPRR